MEAERTVRLIFVRHGETDDNARQVIQGHIDTLLNANGHIQSKITGDYLSSDKIDVCFASELQRASKTAEIILEKHQNTKMHIEPRIKEKYLGKLEGTVYYTEHPPEVMATIEKPYLFLGRLLSFFDDLFPRDGKPSLLPSSPKNLTVLIVSHGGPIKVLLPALVKERGLRWSPAALQRAKDIKFKVWNCSISEIAMKQVRSADGQLTWDGEITKFCDTAHFAEAQMRLKEGTEADAAMVDQEVKRETS